MGAVLGAVLRALDSWGARGVRGSTRSRGPESWGWGGACRGGCSWLPWERRP